MWLSVAVCCIGCCVLLRFAAFCCMLLQMLLLPALLLPALLLSSCWLFVSSDISKADHAASVVPWNRLCEWPRLHVTEHTADLPPETQIQCSRANAQRFGAKSWSSPSPIISLQRRSNPAEERRAFPSLIGWRFSAARTPSPPSSSVGERLGSGDESGSQTEILRRSRL